MRYPRVMTRAEMMEARPQGRMSESEIFCRKCGLGQQDMLLVRSEEDLRVGTYSGLTMYSASLDRETGIEYGTCELCYDGETLQQLASRREREEKA